MPTNVRSLGMLVRKKRHSGGLTLRDVASQTGLKVPTISRVERGDAQDLEGGTLLALCTWVGVNPDNFNEGAPATLPRAANARVVHNTPDAVELYLRADKNLDKRTASALSSLFRTAYETMSNQMRTTKRS